MIDAQQQAPFEQAVARGSQLTYRQASLAEQGFRFPGLHSEVQRAGAGLGIAISYNFV